MTKEEKELRNKLRASNREITKLNTRIEKLENKWKEFEPLLIAMRDIKNLSF